MSENQFKQLNSDTHNSNLNRNGLNVLSSNDISRLNKTINETIVKVDTIFNKLMTNDNYKQNSDLLELYSSYRNLKNEYIQSIRNKNYSEFEIIKTKMDEISKNIISITSNENKVQEEKVEIIHDEPKEEQVEIPINKSIRKKELDEELTNSNIVIFNLVSEISYNKEKIAKIEKFLKDNRPYLDSVEIYGYEKSIKNRQEKIKDEEKELEEVNKKHKQLIDELNKLNDINIAPTEVYDNLKEQIELYKEQERIQSRIADLQEKVPQDYSDMINNSKKINL